MAPDALEIYLHVDRVSQDDLGRLRSWMAQAVPRCLENPGSGERDLPSLDTVEISIVDDEAIARIHGDFLDDPTPTDVITFQHGELIASADTAARMARELGHSMLEELFLYLVHGLLHLNGHLDAVEEDRQIMHEVQDRIWREVLGKGT